MHAQEDVPWRDTGDGGHPQGKRRPREPSPSGFGPPRHAQKSNFHSSGVIFTELALHQVLILQAGLVEWLHLSRGQTGRNQVQRK